MTWRNIPWATSMPDRDCQCRCVAIETVLGSFFGLVASGGAVCGLLHLRDHTGWTEKNPYGRGFDGVRSSRVFFEQLDALDSGRNLARTLPVKASKLAPIHRYSRLNRTTTAQTEQKMSCHCIVISAPHHFQLILSRQACQRAALNRRPRYCFPCKNPFPTKPYAANHQFAKYSCA